MNFLRASHLILKANHNTWQACLAGTESPIIQNVFVKGADLVVSSDVMVISGRGWFSDAPR